MSRPRHPWADYDEHDNPDKPMNELIAHIAQYLADIRDHLETIDLSISDIADKYAPVEEEKSKKEKRK